MMFDENQLAPELKEAITLIQADHTLVGNFHEITAVEQRVIRESYDFKKEISADNQTLSVYETMSGGIWTIAVFISIGPDTYIGMYRN